MTSSVCEECLRRSKLVALLSGYIGAMHVPSTELDQLLSLSNDQLIAAVGGSHRSKLLEQLGGVEPEAVLESCRQFETTAICRHRSEHYPKNLEQLAAQPTALFINGSIDRYADLIERRAVAVVGARKATTYGRFVAERLGRELSSSGVTVVSGMAFGVDSAAHTGALERFANTLAVLAGSSERASPASKSRLYRQLVERAAVVSELPPGSKPRPWLFPARNRLIAALADLTVIVEAEYRSGALITASIAQTLNKDIAAVPGQVTSSLSDGTNGLIVDGALPATSTQGLLDALFGVGVRELVTEPDIEQLALGSELQAVYLAVQSGKRNFNELVEVSNDAGSLQLALADLELRGLIKRDSRGEYVLS